MWLLWEDMHREYRNKQLLSVLLKDGSSNVTIVEDVHKEYSNKQLLSVLRKDESQMWLLWADVHKMDRGGGEGGGHKRFSAPNCMKTDCDI